MARGKRRVSSRPNLYYLPEEILIQILVRLPVKSILQFRSICKSWYSLITCPTFIEAHLNHQTNNTNLLLLNYETEFRHNFCWSIRYDDDESFGEYSEPKLPLDPRYLWSYGSCNGLVCLSDKYLDASSSIFLWNPALRKLKTLPEPQITHIPLHDHEYLVSLAFGFHSEVNDYKVVRIVFFQGSMNNPYKTSFLVEVYSLSTDSWRRIDVLEPSCYITAWRPAFVNGAAYWTAARKPALGVEVYTLFRLEIVTEVLEEVMLPDSAQQSYPRIFCLGELLYILDFDDLAFNLCHIWTMDTNKIGSWTKRFTVDFQCDGFEMLGFRRNGEFLIINRSDKLLSYNLEIQEFKDLGINTYQMTTCAHPYVESLILVDGGGDSFSTC